MNRVGLCFWASALAAGCGPQPDVEPPPEPPIDTCPSGQASSAFGCRMQVAASCPPGQRARIGTAECVAVGRGPCPEGFVADAGGWGCAPVLPASECPAGSMRVLGHSECQPVGWSTCPSGFQLAPSGWGCVAIAPAAACADAELGLIGYGSCQPVSDCNAPFPPANATRFVDPSGPLDATHHHTMQEAIAAAQAFDLIAVERGNYNAQDLRVTRAISIVGRCPAEVIWTGGGTVPGLGVIGVRASVRGVTLVNHYPGFLVGRAGELTISDVVLRNQRGAGVLATNPNSRAIVTRARIDGTRGQQDTQPGGALIANDGGSVTAEEVEISGSRGYGLQAMGAAATIEARHVLIRAMVVVEPGRGVVAAGGASVTLRESAIWDAPENGARALPQGHITLEDVEIRGTGRSNLRGTGAVVAEAGSTLRVERGRLAGGHGAEAGATGANARLELVDVDLVEGAVDVQNFGVGVVATNGATLSISRSALVAHPNGAIAALNAHLSLSRVVLGASFRPGSEGITTQETQIVADQLDVLPSTEGAYQLDFRGPNAEILLRRSAVVAGPNAVFENAHLVMEDSLVDRSPDVSFFVGNSTLPATAPGASAEIRRSVLSNASQGTSDNEAGSFLIDAGSTVRIEDSDIAGNYREGAYVMAGGRLELVNAIVRGTVSASDGTNGNGVQIAGTLLAINSAFVRNAASGVGVRVGGQANVMGSLFAENGVAGLFSASTLPLEVIDSAFESNQAVTFRGSTHEFGFGLLLAGEGHAERVVVRNNHSAGIGVDGDANPNGLLSVSDSLIEATQPDDTGYGHGVIVVGSSARIERCALIGNNNVGIVFFAARGLVSDSLIAGNRVGAHVQQGTELKSVDTAGEVPTGLEALFTADTRFVDNETRVGLGMIPVPSLADEGPEPMVVRH